MGAEYIPRQWRSHTARDFCFSTLLAAFEVSELNNRHLWSKEAFKDRVLGPDLYPELERPVTRRYAGNVTPLRNRPVPLERFRAVLQVCMASLVDDGQMTEVDREACEEIMGWREPAAQAEIVILPNSIRDEAASSPADQEATIIRRAVPQWAE